MNILRNILRFGLIAIFVVVLIFLSMKIFNLIPKAINNIASATVSLGSLNEEKPTATSTIPQQPSPTTADGLNGVILQPSQTPTQPVASATSTPIPTQINRPVTQPQTPSYQTYQPTTQTRTETRYIYYPAISTAKNIKVTLSSIGIINSNGQYVITNSFNSNDTVSVRFKIINEEASPTGLWSMRVTMPASDYADKVKILSNLSSIPGESSYTAEARFTGIDMSQSNPTVYIQADPENQISESNESDNTLSVRLPTVQTYYPNTYYNSGNTCYLSNGYYTCPNVYTDQCYNINYGYYPCNSNTNTYNSGNPNLIISTIETGRMVGGSFYQSTTIPYGERVTVRALVRNTGGHYTNSWTTRLGIQNQGTGYREQNSSYQPPIQPSGDMYVYFDVDNLIRGNHTMTLQADAQNNVSEVDENDNSKTVNVYIN